MRVLSVLLAFACGAAYAESTSVPVEPTLTNVVRYATLAEGMPLARGVAKSICAPSAVDTEPNVPVGAVLVLVRRLPCPNMGSRKTFHVYFAGKSYYASDYYFEKGSAPELDAVPGIWGDELGPVAEELAEASRLATRKQIDSAKAALAATAKSGLAILKTAVYEFSEHTKATGFKAEIVNTGTKTIKYVTFTVVGYNTVKDPVRDPMKHASTLTLKVAGPFEPKEVASFSKDIFWFTDLVETADVKQVRLDYMDGSSKVISNPNSLYLRPIDARFAEALSKLEPI